MIFFGRARGSILAGVMFLVLVLFFWTPLGTNVFKMYEGYTETFKVRFPILYIAFYLISFFLETIQDYQFHALERINAINENYSIHDQLTGLYNRKGFYDRLGLELKTRTYDKIGFVVFDIDLSITNLNLIIVSINKLREVIHILLEKLSVIIAVLVIFVEVLCDLLAFEIKCIFHNLIACILDVCDCTACHRNCNRGEAET